MSTKAQKQAILERLRLPQEIEPCGDCDGFVQPGAFSYIRLPLKDAEGNPVYDRDSNLRHTQVAMKTHVLPRTKFDTTGLVPAACDHGIKTHPDPEIQNSQAGRQAVTWIRSKYVRVGGRAGSSCPVCRGEEPPEDLAVPAS